MICRIESVDPVGDLCLTNQIYSVLLNAFEFEEITEVQNAHFQILLEDGETRTRRSRPSNAQKCFYKMAKLEGDETQPRGCKYPTPLSALSKILRVRV